MTINIDKLVELHPGEIIITANEHLNNDCTVFEMLEDYSEGSVIDQIKPDVLSEMISRNVMVCVQIYPDGPGSFKWFFHWDINQSIDLAAEWLAQHRVLYPVNF